MTFRIGFSAVILVLAMTGAAVAETRRVLLLHSFGRDFAPWNEYARTIREELGKRSKESIDIFEASLATARSGDIDEGPFVDYLRALFSKQRLDLVITIGAPAVNFFQQRRGSLFPSVPAVHTGLEKRRVPVDTLTEKDAVVAVSIDLTKAVEGILEVLPKTDIVAVVIGNSPIEKYWLGQMREAVKPLENRIGFAWFNEMSFEEMLERAATLPENSAIFFVLLSVDAGGTAHEESKALARLRAAVNAPIFTHSDAFFGQGVVGGPLTVVADVGRQAAGAAVRILNGEDPSSVRTPPIGFAAPKFDWRELQRWNISESHLPPGSEVHFRVPSLWEQYWPHFAAVLAAVLFQAAIIAWLLMERGRRQAAEVEANERRREVVRLNRVTTANVLSSSIAHELNQPLGAILSNTEAAQLLLRASPPDIGQLDEILSDIVRDERRASEIILGLANLLRNKTVGDLHGCDLHVAVRDVVKIVSPEVTRRGVTLRTILAPETLLVRCDPIHLQQVLINLVMNGLDAMEEAPKPHNLMIRTSPAAESNGVEVRISDSGKGIAEAHLPTIFDAFFTTKPQGTGLGLPIARTIIESYGGEIWAENRQRGAVFSFRLPVVKAHAD
jgi:signal transduction histidine kinase